MPSRHPKSSGLKLADFRLILRFQIPHPFFTKKFLIFSILVSHTYLFRLKSDRLNHLIVWLARWRRVDSTVLEHRKAC